jgi:isoquinoline 1-oxidoreductase beta subunit
MNETTQAKPVRTRAAKWTRRGLIGAGVVAGGGLLIGVGVRPGNPLGKLGPIVANGAGEELINSWVKIGADNLVTAIVPHCEMGQGAHSVLAQMLADELDADWLLVRVMQAPADGNYVVTDSARQFVMPGTLDAPDWLEPTWNGLFTHVARLADAMITGGSASIRATGQHTMRIAGAAAREMLIAAAADAWGVPAREIATANSILSHKKSGRSAPYSQFAAAAADQDMPQTPKLKAPEAYRLMGTSAPRTDIPDKVNGAAVFGIDATVPDQQLTYAAIRVVPVPGTKVTAMDASQAKSMPGVLQILNLGDFIAVVADGYWQAQQALNTIAAKYSSPESKIRSSEDQFARFTAALDEAGKAGGDAAVTLGDTAAAMEGAAKRLAAEYRVPFLAHAPLEPMNATVWVLGGQCDIWTSTQVPLVARTAAAKVTGLSKENVTIHQAMLGGAFGRRLEVDYVVQAARIGLATGYPVKMIWSREEDTQKGLFRCADISRFEGGLDDRGQLVAYNNVFTQRHDPSDAFDCPFYDIPNKSIRVAAAELHLPPAALRSVDHSQQGFFIESFIDEAAHAAGRDPLGYRLAMLKNSPRHKAVLEKVAAVSGWNSKLAKGRGRGVALVESFGTIVAEVVEVEMAGGTPRLTGIWCVADPGFAMNPDGFRNQMEGGIIYGLTAALYGEISLKDGAVEQSNFHDYKMLRMNECPQIAVEIINGNPAKLGGGGEPGLPPAAPALANAIFAAAGKRIRDLPIAKHFA